MKVVKAMIFFAVIAVALGQNPSLKVPESIGGMLIRTKSSFLKKTADKFDHIMYKIKSFLPFGSTKFVINTKLVKPSTVTQKPVVTTSTESTVSNCSKKEAFSKRLAEVSEYFMTIQKNINNGLGEGLEVEFEKALNASVTLNDTKSLRDLLQVHQVLYEHRSMLDYLSKEMEELNSLKSFYNSCP